MSGIPPEVRRLLVCPNCHGPLEDGSEGESLDCPACGLRFPVREGIPIMLVEQATKVER